MSAGRIVGDYQTWAYSAIRETFPLFPPALLSGAGDTGLAMLPLFDDVDRGISPFLRSLLQSLSLPFSSRMLLCDGSH